MQQRALEREALPHPAREPAHVIVGAIGEAGAFERDVHDRARLETVQVREERQVLARRQLRIQKQLVAEQSESTSQRDAEAIGGVLQRRLHGAADLHLVGDHAEFDPDWSLDLARDDPEGLGDREARTEAADHQLDRIGEVRVELVDPPLDHLADDEVWPADPEEQTKQQR